MKILLMSATPVLGLLLSGCGVGDLAKTATDAAACNALSSSLSGITTAYQSGLVDSGLISTINGAVGEQAKKLLTTGLAEDLVLLGNALGQTQGAESSQLKVEEITASITQRCSEVGVTISQ